jgi:phosphoenolpyruvate carboxykinase (ATP)
MFKQPILKVLTPKETWSDQSQYEKYLKNLIQQFQNNFKKFSVSEAIVAAGPSI